MGLLTKERTKTTAGEARDAAMAARVAANRAKATAADAVAVAWRAAQGEDRFEKLKAEADLPRLRVALAQAEAEAERAKAEYDRADAAWREERAAFWRPKFAAAVRDLDAALEQARQKNDAALAIAMQARADGGSAGVWYECCWPELVSSSPTRPSRLDVWRTALRKNNWL